MNHIDKSKNPLISIITISFNSEEYIEDTIKSVISQTYNNFEYIIIDGNSTDNTVNIIKKYKENIDYWVSESDFGISDAFNKGIKKASGHILMLNSGDILIDNNVLSLCSKYLNDPLVSFEVINQMKRTVGLAHYKKKSRYNLARLPHQGTFVHKSIYKEYGAYSTGFRIRMDYEFFAKIIPTVEPKLIYEKIVLYDNTGISSTLKNKFRFEFEGLIIEYLYFDKSASHIIILLIIKLLKSTISSLLRKLGIRK